MSFKPNNEIGGNLPGGQLSRWEQSEIPQFIHSMGIFFTGAPLALKREAVKVVHFDEPDGNYGVVIGDHIAYRYEVLRVIGAGTYSRVVAAYDHKDKVKVAVKIVKNRKAEHDASWAEVQHFLRLEKQLKQSQLQAGIIRMRQHFYFRGHLCMVFPLLGPNVYRYLRRKRFHMPTFLIRHIARMLFRALAALHGQGLVHCDVKPENMVVSYPPALCQLCMCDPGGNGLKSSGENGSEARSKCIDLLFRALRSQSSGTGPRCLSVRHVAQYLPDVTLVDLGSARPSQGKLPVGLYIQSRFYRAPEVLLDIGCTPSIDVWSVGCVLVELWTGRPLFPGRSTAEMLQLLSAQLGEVPPSIRAAAESRYAERLAVSRRTGRMLRGLPLEGYVFPWKKSRSSKLSGLVVDQGSQQTWQAVLGPMCKDSAFINFVSRLIQWDPNDRLTAVEALRHPFLMQSDNSILEPLSEIVTKLIPHAIEPAPSSKGSKSSKTHKTTGGHKSRATGYNQSVYRQHRNEPHQVGGSSNRSFPVGPRVQGAQSHNQWQPAVPVQPSQYTQPAPQYRIPASNSQQSFALHNNAPSNAPPGRNMPTNASQPNAPGDDSKHHSVVEKKHIAQAASQNTAGSQGGHSFGYYSFSSSKKAGAQGAYQYQMPASNNAFVQPNNGSNSAQTAQNGEASMLSATAKPFKMSPRTMPDGTVRSGRNSPGGPSVLERRTRQPPPTISTRYDERGGNNPGVDFYTQNPRRAESFENLPQCSNRVALPGNANLSNARSGRLGVPIQHISRTGHHTPRRNRNSMHQTFYASANNSRGSSPKEVLHGRRQGSAQLHRYNQGDPYTREVSSQRSSAWSMNKTSGSASPREFRNEYSRSSLYSDFTVNSKSERDHLHSKSSSQRGSLTLNSPPLPEINSRRTAQSSSSNTPGGFQGVYSYSPTHEGGTHRHATFLGERLNNAVPNRFTPSSQGSRSPKNISGSSSGSSRKGTVFPSISVVGPTREGNLYTEDGAVRLSSASYNRSGTWTGNGQGGVAGAPRRSSGSATGGAGAVHSGYSVQGRGSGSIERTRGGQVNRTRNFHTRLW